MRNADSFVDVTTTGITAVASGRPGRLDLVDASGPAQQAYAPTALRTGRVIKLLEISR